PYSFTRAISRVSLLEYISSCGGLLHDIKKQALGDYGDPTPVLSPITGRHFGIGGDGGELNAPSKKGPTSASTLRIRQLFLASERLYRRRSWTPTRNLRPVLQVWDRQRP